MATRTITADILIIDHVDSETPLLDAEALRPCYEHEARKMLREVENVDK